MPDLDQLRLTEEGRDFLRFVIGHRTALPPEDVMMERIETGRKRFGEAAFENAAAVIAQIPDDPAAAEKWASRTKIRV